MNFSSSLLVVLVLLVLGRDAIAVNVENNLRKNLEASTGPALDADIEPHDGTGVVMEHLTKLVDESADLTCLIEAVCDGCDCGVGPADFAPPLSMEYDTMYCLESCYEESFAALNEACPHDIGHDMDDIEVENAGEGADIWDIFLPGEDLPEGYQAITSENAAEFSAGLEARANLLDAENTTRGSELLQTSLAEQLRKHKAYNDIGSLLDVASLLQEDASAGSALAGHPLAANNYMQNLRYRNRDNDGNMVGFKEEAKEWFKAAAVRAGKWSAAEAQTRFEDWDGSPTTNQCKAALQSWQTTEGHFDNLVTSPLTTAHDGADQALQYGDKLKQFHDDLTTAKTAIDTSHTIVGVIAIIPRVRAVMIRLKDALTKAKERTDSAHKKSKKAVDFYTSHIESKLESVEEKTAQAMDQIEAARKAHKDYIQDPLWLADEFCQAVSIPSCDKSKHFTDSINNAIDNVLNQINTMMPELNIVRPKLKLAFDILNVHEFRTFMNFMRTLGDLLNPFTVAFNTRVCVELPSCSGCSEPKCSGCGWGGCSGCSGGCSGCHMVSHCITVGDMLNGLVSMIGVVMNALMLPINKILEMIPIPSLTFPLPNFDINFGTLPSLPTINWPSISGFNINAGTICGVNTPLNTCSPWKDMMVPWPNNQCNAHAYHDHTPHGHTPHDHNPYYGGCGGLLEVAEDMEHEPQPSALSTQGNCDACIRVVTEASDAIKAGQDLEVGAVFSLFKEECDLRLSDDEELLQECYAEIEPEKTLSHDDLVWWLSNYSATEICSGHAKDYFVNFCV